MKVTFKGNPVNLGGNELKVGDMAPKVNLAGNDLSEVTVGGAKDHVQIIVAVPSLDTGVCEAQTRKMNESIAGAVGMKMTVISMDLPFANGRFCATNGIQNVTTASDFRAKEFGNAYGVLISEGPMAGLLTRAIFVVGKDGKIAYKQIVAEITNEPDYEDLKNAIGQMEGVACGAKCCC